MKLAYVIYFDCRPSLGELRRVVKAAFLVVFSLFATVLEAYIFPFRILFHMVDSCPG